MSERKYRQRGYQDSGRAARPKERPAPEDRPPREMRAPSMPAFRRVVKCARCGNSVDADILALSACSRCNTDLRSCVNCEWFDPASRFECAQPVKARITPKDARNECPHFSARTIIERETSSTGPPDARKAFDDLFK